MYEKPTANIIFNGEKLKAFPLRSEKRQGCPLLPLLINMVLEVLATATRQEKERKKNSNWKVRSNLSLFVDDMILYIENCKDSTIKLREFINEFGKVIGHIINIHKSFAFLFTNNELSETN